MLKPGNTYNSSPAQLKNLIPFKPGVASNNRNLSGRPALGVSYLEWLKVLEEHDPETGIAKYDNDQLVAIRDDPCLCRTKRAAAADLVILPLVDRGKALERILDRTIGKPVQSVIVTKAPPLNNLELTDSVNAMLAKLGASPIQIVADVPALPAPDDEA